LDEVQRVPTLFTAIKAAVDQGRCPGRFLLTGSANVLLVPKLADSLAGSMEILRLHPLAQCELAGHSPAFLDAPFEGREVPAQSKEADEEMGNSIPDTPPAAGELRTPTAQCPAASREQPGARCFDPRFQIHDRFLQILLFTSLTCRGTKQPACEPWEAKGRVPVDG
jgi:hypothetical protein